MCNPSASAGIVRDATPSEVIVGLIAAHELGHVLNMRHDDDCKFKNIHFKMKGDTEI